MMGGNLRKKTPNQNLAHVASGEDRTFAIDLTHPNFRSAFRSLSFNTLMEFTNSPLEMNDKVANTLIDCKSSSWRDDIFSQTLKDYFKVTSEMLNSFSSSAQLVPTTNEVGEEDHQPENLLEYFNEKCKSLEQQLLTHKSKINPKMKTYRKLQVAGKMLGMVSLIAPITGTLLVGEKLPLLVASLASVSFGAAGSWTSFFCERKKEELKVKEGVISLMLMSIAFQKNNLNGISDLVNGGRLVQDAVFSKAVDEYLSQVRKERKTILQKLSEYDRSSGVNFTLVDIV